MTRRPVFGLAALSLLLAGAATAAGPTTGPAAGQAAVPSAEELATWWADLAEPDPDASATVLKFYDHPAEAVAFFKAKLLPLKMTDAELDKRLPDLGSDDPAVWRPAFDALGYFDPRLTRGLQTLMDTVKDNPARSRLVAVLCDAPPDKYDGRAVELNGIGEGNYNFVSGNWSWWAEGAVARLNGTHWGTHKAQWTRAVRAMVILRHLNTPDANAILADLATGHPDAWPTKVAKGETQPKSAI